MTRRLFTYKHTHTRAQNAAAVLSRASTSGAVAVAAAAGFERTTYIKARGPYVLSTHIKIHRRRPTPGRSLSSTAASKPRDVQPAKHSIYSRRMPAPGPRSNYVPWEKELVLLLLLRDAAARLIIHNLACSASAFCCANLLPQRKTKSAKWDLVCAGKVFTRALAAFECFVEFTLEQ
jgi:hypothetical protein